MKTTWKELIEGAMASEGEGESWADVEACTLTNDELLAPFCDGFGASTSKAFFLWTARNVYFSATYDGSDHVCCVPRHPCGAPVGHAADF